MSLVSTCSLLNSSAKPQKLHPVRVLYLPTQTPPIPQKHSHFTKLLLCPQHILLFPTTFQSRTLHPNTIVNCLYSLLTILKPDLIPSINILDLYVPTSSLYPDLPPLPLYFSFAPDAIPNSFTTPVSLIAFNHDCLCQKNHSESHPFTQAACLVYTKSARGTPCHVSVRGSAASGPSSVTTTNPYLFTHPRQLSYYIAFSMTVRGCRRPFPAFHCRPPWKVFLFTCMDLHADHGFPRPTNVQHFLTFYHPWEHLYFSPLAAKLCTSCECEARVFLILPLIRITDASSASCGFLCARGRFRPCCD
jgi:hypothetical protein